jgi:SPP1 family phage portal protein
VYPMSPTQTEELIQAIIDGAPKLTEIIQDYIDSHSSSVAKMSEGVNYYFNKTEIKNRKKYYYDNDGNKIEDTEGINNKIPHGWHKLLVDQKVSYLVGQPITITSEDKDLAEKVKDTLGEDLEDTLPELVKNGSNKGREWLHPFIDEEGNFDYVTIPAEQGIPIYDNSKRKNLEAFIRYYYLDDDLMKIELWDREKVTFYEKINGEIVLDVNEEINPAPHYTYGPTDSPDGYGWGEVPFIEFANNEERVSDLVFYKELIDEYDKTDSDVANNLEEIQALIYVLKGYEGTSLAELMSNIRKYKAIAMDAEEGAGVDTIQAEVPIASVDSHLDRTGDNIILFGQGVDPSPDKFGNNPAGVALKNLYSLLDMKSNVLERKFNTGLSWLYWFVVEYLKITNQVSDVADYKTIKSTFNKTMLTNEQEQITMARDSVGVISKRTIVANHPWTTDVEDELKELEKEADEYARHLDPLDDGDDEE